MNEYVAADVYCSPFGRQNEAREREQKVKKHSTPFNIPSLDLWPILLFLSFRCAYEFLDSRAPRVHQIKGKRRRATLRTWKIGGRFVSIEAPSEMTARCSSYEIERYNSKRLNLWARPNSHMRAKNCKKYSISQRIVFTFNYHLPSRSPDTEHFTAN